MLRDRIPDIKCITYGCPSCVDSVISDELKDCVTSVILRDDIISRITPQSIRILMKEIILFRSEVFKHVQQDWADVIERAINLWKPRKRLNDHIKKSKNDNSKSITPILDLDENDVLNENLILVDEDYIPELWIPGKILHIYSHRGLYKIKQVDRTFATLRKIEVQGNIFKDHTLKSIFEGLLEVKAVRNAKSQPNIWIAFNEVNVCLCCRNPFTWHSTFRGDLSEYKERYNCRCCGGLICDLCSKNKVAIPKFGLLYPTRICDSCFIKGEYSL